MTLRMLFSGSDAVREKGGRTYMWFRMRWEERRQGAEAEKSTKVSRKQGNRRNRIGTEEEKDERKQGEETGGKVGQEKTGDFTTECIITALWHNSTNLNLFFSQKKNEYSVGRKDLLINLIKIHLNGW